ncbi:hypothetical protein [Streptomyces sp. NPDC002889]|uniref:thiolase family protein n=1 Tax=Streptomyces sp. NPDC002889 TaxID=3364669 RepID=UPI0036BD5B0C
MRSLAERTGVDPALVDDVVRGCVSQVGEQPVNIDRNAVLAAGWPERVPGTVVERQRGSSRQAVHFAGVRGGLRSVRPGGRRWCRVDEQGPDGAVVTAGPVLPFGPKMGARYGGVQFNQDVGAEMIAEKRGPVPPGDGRVRSPVPGAGGIR